MHKFICERIVWCMMDKKRRFFLIVTIIIFWSSFLFFVGPATLLSWLGDNNALLITFLVATFGGVSIFTAISFYSALAAFVAAGVNPYQLGIVGGVGLTLGDSLFYYLGYSGRQVLYGKPKEWANELSNWLLKKPLWMIPLVTFIYATAVPLPNDILTVSLGFSHVKYKRILLPLLLGNILFTIFIVFVVRTSWLL